jgi:hypothetical protein
VAIVTVKGVAAPIDRAPRANAPVLGAVALEADAGTKMQAEGANRFEVVVDGSPIRIDASGVAAAFLKLEERSVKGAWAEVERDPLASPFLDKAPGPHVPVRLHGEALLPGEVVHVLGEITATEPIPDTGSMRRPPAQRPSEIRAIAVAAGPNAEGFIHSARAEMVPAAARPASPSGPVPWSSLVGGALVVAVGALIVAAALASSAARVELWLLALTGTGFVIRLRWTPPRFRGREAQPSLGWWDLYYLVAFLGFAASTLLFLATVAGVFGVTDDLSDVAPILVPLLGALVLVLPLEAWSTSRQFHRVARIILDAPARPAEDGAWSGVAGVVADPTPIRWADEDAAIGRSVEADKEPAIGVVDTFDINTGKERVAVDPAEACWATLVTRQKTVTPGEGTNNAKTLTEEWIPVGASIVGAGRLRRSESAATMTSTGPESLLLFAAPAGSDAREELEALLTARRSRLYLLSGIAVLAVASALAFIAPLVRAAAGP